jgi:membrane protein
VAAEPRSRLIRIFRGAALRFSAEGTPFLAQALAFNVLFAAIPLLLVGVALIAFVFGTDEGIARANEAIGLYAPQLQDLVANNLDAVVRYKGLTGAIGLLTLAWSGKNLFGGMTYALNRSLGVVRYRHYVWDVVVGLTLVPLVGVALVVATALPVVITLIVQFARLESLRWAPQIASYAGSLGLVFIVISLLYAYLPNRRPVNWRAVLVGAAVASVGYSIAQIAFAIYTTYAANAFRVYGALSALFVLLLWLDLIGIVFLFGAHVSAAWEREAQSEELPLAS